MPKIRIIENRNIAGLIPVWFAPQCDVKGTSGIEFVISLKNRRSEYKLQVACLSKPQPKASTLGGG